MSENTEQNVVSNLANKLLDVIRSATTVRSEHLLVVVTWVVLGKLSAEGRLPQGSQLKDYLDPSKWLNLTEIGLTQNTCIDLSRDAENMALTSRLFSLMTDQLARGVDDWACPDLVWHLKLGSNKEFLGLHPNLADHLVKALNLGAGDTVLVPFDSSGQLITRLLLKGVKAVSAPLANEEADLCRLLCLLIEDEPFEKVKILSDGVQSAITTEFTHCLCTPPLGVKVTESMAWTRWKTLPTHRPFAVGPNDMERSEAWSVATFWPRVTDRAVFLTSPSLLYSQGQELRLREALLQPKNQISGVVSLPMGTSSITNIAMVMLVLNDPAEPTIRMIDLSKEPRTDSIATAKQLDRMDGIWESRAPIEQIACEVLPEAIWANELSLFPPRYTRRIENLAGPRVALADLVDTLVRPPAAGKSGGPQVWEVGIAQLDRWAPITGGLSKQVSLTSKKPQDVLLQPGDVVISVKGSLGRCGLIGEIDNGPDTDDDAGVLNLDHRTLPPNAAIVSSSCIAVRPKRDRVIPEYLLAYMRSNEFERQLEALQVGAAINHINPNDLLKSVMVPALSIEEQGQFVEAAYAELRELEYKLDELTDRLRRRRQQLFCN